MPCSHYFFPCAGYAELFFCPWVREVVDLQYEIDALAGLLLQTQLLRGPRGEFDKCVTQQLDSGSVLRRQNGCLLKGYSIGVFVDVFSDTSPFAQLLLSPVGI